MNRLFLFQFIYYFLSYVTLSAYDLTVVGVMREADGLNRIPIGLIDTLKDEISINFISLGTDLKDVNQEVQKIVRSSQPIPGNVSILTMMPVWPPHTFYKYVPESPIKIAYSMFESTRIPPDWVDIFNKHFDAVVVPDPYLVKVYESSGVKIPVFMLPLGMYLDDFFQKKHPKFSHKPFVFGCSSTFIARKNISTLIQAFTEEFGNSEDVLLYLHGRTGEIQYQYAQEDIKVSNIILSQNPLNKKKYINFMSSIDCYVNISKGEGFSCCPREALAMGIPCILSDNTAHHTICRKGFVRSVPAKKKEKALCSVEMYNPLIGHQFGCEIADVRKALRDVYHDYTHYLNLARSGRKWVSKYTWSNLKSRYLTLVKPKQVILGEKNMITKDYLMTNSPKLYMKYLNLPIEETNNVK